MNTRRTINNIYKKEGFENLYVVNYSHNWDMRGNNSCLIREESVRFINGQIEFYDKTRLQEMSRILKASQKELVKLITEKINELNQPP